MPSQSFPIHITEFCRRLCQHRKLELRRLEENPEDTCDGFFDKPRPYDAVVDWLATRSGEKFEDVVRYMHRCEHGCAWGEVKRLKDKQGNYEIWPDISAIAQRIAAYFQPNVMNELLALFCEEYPIEAREMGLELRDAADASDGPHKPKTKRKKRGPETKHNPADDEKLIDDWKGSGRTKAEFEKVKGLDAGTVVKAVDRVRNRRPKS